MIIASLRGKTAFQASYFFGFCFNLFSLYWVVMVTPPGMLSAVVIVALYYAAILFAFNRLYHVRPAFGIIAVPCLWVGMEYFRTLSEFAFPWSDLGYSQAYYLYILQIVSVISVHGLSLLIVVVNVLLWQLLRNTLSPERRLTAFFASVGIIAALVAHGWIVTPAYPKPGSYGVTLLQGSVPLDIKWSEGSRDYVVGLYDSLANTVAADSSRLYIWPETAVPCYMTHDRTCRLTVGEIARRTHAYHLVGAMGVTFEKDNRQRHFNSCYQFSPAGEMERRYDKVKLVPFSEQAPYQDYLPFLKQEFLRHYLTFIDNYGVQWWSDFHPGNDSSLVFVLPDARYAVLICFESTFPEFSRRAIREGADFLVGITNDTWFGSSVGIHMHSRIFITRAVENRCWAARVANTGLTFIVDGYGHSWGSVEPYQVAALTGKVGFLDDFSVFTRYGDLAGRFSFLITISVIGILPALWILGKILDARHR
jgi:apolipoprotein N-acyltransferase